MSIPRCALFLCRGPPITTMVHRAHQDPAARVLDTKSQRAIRGPLGEATQQLPVALAHAALSMDANSALKPEAPRILTLVSMKPYDVTPTTPWRVRLRTPVGAALSGSPKF